MLSNTTNNTEGEGEPAVVNTSSLGVTIYGTSIGTFIFTANVILLVTLLRFKSAHLKDSTRYFLMNKSLSYSLEGLLLICWPHVPLKHCFYFIVFGVASLRSIIWGMFLLSLDSFITIIRPYTHKYIMTPRLAKALLILLCLTQGVYILLYSLFGQTKPHLSHPYCITDDGAQGPVSLLVHSVLGIVIIFATLVMQAVTLCYLWKKSNMVKPTSTNQQVLPSVSHAVSAAVSQPNPAGNNKVKKPPTRLGRLVQLLAVSTICTTLCWLPSTFVNTAYYLGLLPISNAALEELKRYFGVLNAVDAVLQPGIVIMMSQELRAAVKKLFCKSG